MERPGDGYGLIFLSFLADSQTNELQQELESLAKDIKVPTAPSRYTEEGGELQTDGHTHSNLRAFLGDLQPQVDPQGPGTYKHSNIVIYIQ